MRSTMMDVPLSLNHLLERAGTLFPSNEIVSRLPAKSLVRHTYGEYHRRPQQADGQGRSAGATRADGTARRRGGGRRLTPVPLA